MKLKGKVAVITGVSYGLGRSICDVFLKEGMQVYGISRTKPAVKDTNFFWLKADLEKSSEIKKIISQIKTEKVDILVNNAGTVVLEKTIDYSDSAFNKTFKLNFIAAAKISAILLPKLVNGLVVNISSTSAKYAEPEYGLYCASKSALELYFDAFAEENNNVKVINLLPTYMNTPLQHTLVASSEFDWKLAMNTDDVARGVLDILKGVSNIATKTRIMMLSSSTMDELIEEEKLWYYNVDTKELKKIK